MAKVFSILTSLTALLLVLFSHSLAAIAAEDTMSPRDFSQTFGQGVSLYQSGKFQEAATEFEAAAKLNTGSAEVFVNWGLAEYNLQKMGLALGLLRKALTIDGENRTATDAIEFILKQKPPREVPHEIKFSETLRENVLIPTNLHLLLGICLFSFFAFGWTGLSFLGARKKAHDESRDAPGAPWVSIVCLLLFIALLGIIGLKSYDSATRRGTIMVEKVEVKSSSSEDSASISELYEGLEVVILSTDKSWVQVNYPGGVSGWVQESQIFFH